MKMITHFISPQGDSAMSEAKTRARINKQLKIKVLVEDNPKRTGTLSFERFALYETGMTVEEYVAAGGRSGDIGYDVEAGYIALVE
jgi:hypothetical protein